MTDTIIFKNNNQTIRTEERQDKAGSSFDVKDDILDDYIAKSNTQLNFDGNIHIIQLAANSTLAKPNTPAKHNNEPRSVGPNRPGNCNNWSVTPDTPFVFDNKLIISNKSQQPTKPASNNHNSAQPNRLLNKTNNNNLISVKPNISNKPSSYLKHNKQVVNAHNSNNKSIKHN